MTSTSKLKLEAPENFGSSHPHPSQVYKSGSDYVARLNQLNLTGNSKSPTPSSLPPPISGHDLMAIFPTVAPTSDVCCNDIFSKQARAYLSGARESTASASSDARHRRTSSCSSLNLVRNDMNGPRSNGLDALAEQACLESPVRTPPDRGGSRNVDRTEQDAEGGINRPLRSRHSKVQRDSGLLRDATPDRRSTTTPRHSPPHSDSPTPLFTRRPLERTSFPRFVPHP